MEFNIQCVDILDIYFVTCNQRVILTGPKNKRSNILKEPNILKVLTYCKLAKSIDCSKDKCVFHF